MQGEIVPSDIAWWRDMWWLIMFAILAFPLSSIVVFGVWMRRQRQIKADAAAMYWDVFIKLMSALTVVVTGAMLFGKYIDQIDDAQRLRQAAEQRDRDIRKTQEQRDHDIKVAEFLRLQLQFDLERYQQHKQLLGEARLLAADLATGSEEPDNKLLRRFEELYYADLIGVEGVKVEGAMVEFRKKLKGLVGASDKTLEQLALDLSRECNLELKAFFEKILEQQRRIVELTKTPIGSPPAAPAK